MLLLVKQIQQPTSSPQQLTTFLLPHGVYVRTGMFINADVSRICPATYKYVKNDSWILPL